MRHLSLQRHVFSAALLIIAVSLGNHASGQADPGDILSTAQLQKLDASVERGLAWLAAKQQPDGSFPTAPTGQPGVTGLCVLAFVGHGHLPGQGVYGEQLTKAVDYIVAQQKRNGVLSSTAPNGVTISRNVNHHIGYTAQYNHALAGLALSELYAMENADRARELRSVIRKALDATAVMQQWPKERPADRGGWRYLDDYAIQDSDLSVTGWQLMFMRSATNAGFDVDKQRIDDAVGYVRRCFDKKHQTFVYEIPRPGFDGRPSRAMAGAGILALAHAGLHDTREAKAAGDWLLKNRFDVYNDIAHGDDHYHYGLLTCCQAMYQLGGRHWEEFFPPTVTAITKNQAADGSWSRETDDRVAYFGNAYTSASCLIGLGAPNQLLPIFQR